MAARLALAHLGRKERVDDGAQNIALELAEGPSLQQVNRRCEGRVRLGQLPDMALRADRFAAYPLADHGLLVAGAWVYDHKPYPMRVPKPAAKSITASGMSPRSRAAGRAPVAARASRPRAR